MAPTRLGLGCLALVLTAVSPCTAAAQQEAPEAWRSTLEFGFQGASGNASFSILSAAGSLTRVEQERYEFALSGRLRYGTSGDDVIANDVRTTAKFDWLPNSDLSPFVFGTVSRDVTRNVDAQVVGGGGAKWTFYRSPGGSSKVSVSLAAILDYENYRLQAGDTSPETSNVSRLSSRLKYDHTFSSGAAFQHITFWQPRFSGFSDYLVDVSNSVTTPLTTNLSLVINHTYVHDAVPPPGAVRDDQRLGVALRVAL
ncbi:MAG: DUF481 domain-containing protein [Gemmatimonadota bacterium]